MYNKHCLRSVILKLGTYYGDRNHRITKVVYRVNSELPKLSIVNSVKCLHKVEKPVSGYKILKKIGLTLGSIIHISVNSIVN